MKWVINLVAAVAALCIFPASVHAHQTTTERQVGTGGEFNLQSLNGPVTLGQFHGRIVLMFFGFTSCPDICPVTLAILSKAFSRLTEDELEKVAALFISLDPDRDTPEVLKKYTSYFHTNIIGVTADIQALNRLVANYGITYERRETPDSPLGYAIYHTPDILIVNQQGHLLDTRIPHTATAGEIADKIMTLLVPTNPTGS